MMYLELIVAPEERKGLDTPGHVERIVAQCDENCTSGRSSIVGRKLQSCYTIVWVAVAVCCCSYCPRPTTGYTISYSNRRKSIIQDRTAPTKIRTSVADSLEATSPKTSLNQVQLI